MKPESASSRETIMFKVKANYKTLRKTLNPETKNETYEAHRVKPKIKMRSATQPAASNISACRLRLRKRKLGCQHGSEISRNKDCAPKPVKPKR